MAKYKSIEDMDIDKVGLCMVPGHPKEHKLDMKPCWTTMRAFFFRGHSWAEFVEAVETKR